MCGIFGVFSKENISGSEVRNAVNKISRRGPDDEGYVDLEEMVSYAGNDTPEKIRDFHLDLDWSSCENVSSRKWLGHRRLAIQGSVMSHQPMRFQDKWMVFEGEVYNKEELREELIDQGYSFNTDGDTEVILKAEDCWGLEKLSEKVRGMYAIAIYDKFSDELRLVSDSLGKKPIYYTRTDSIFAFASEIKPLLQLPGIEAAQNHVKVLHYLKHGLVDNNRETFFEGIYRLQPGEVIKFDGEMKLEKYTELRRREGNLEKALEDSLKTRLEGDKVAVSLSGGVDSAVLSVIAKEDADYYFASFPESEFDESEKVAKIEEKIDIDVNKMEFRPGFISKCLKSDIRTLEEPVVSPAAHAYIKLSEKAREDGNKIFVTGSGSDELFSGYSTDIVYRIYNLIRKGKFLQLMGFYRDFYNRLDPRHYFKLAGYFFPKKIRSFVLEKSRDRKWLDTTQINNFPDILANPSDYTQRVKQNCNSGIVQSVLRFGNKAVSKNSMEMRGAYIDRKLIEAVIGGDESQNFKNGQTKYPVRNLFREELPDFLTEGSQKIGYVPEFEGLLGEKDMSNFEKIIESDVFKSRELIDAEKVISEYRNSDLSDPDIYRIWSYELWLREFIDD